MRIGELSRRSGLSPSRIRFYEACGLLKGVSRGPNGYRAYPAPAVLTLRLIVAAQDAGFSLEEIRHLVPKDVAWDREALLATLWTKVAEIQNTRERLAQTEAHLLSVIDQVRNKPGDLDCTENARRVLAHAARLSAP